MVIEIEYLNILPLEYKKAVKSLNRKLKITNEIQNINRLLVTFVEKYTTVPEIWKYWRQISIRNHADLTNLMSFIGITQQAYKHFREYSFNISKTAWPDFPNLKCIVSSTERTYEKRLEISKILISLPHSMLSEALDFYIELTGDHISKSIKEKYTESCKLHEKILEADEKNDSKKLLEAFMETKDEEFIVKNFEFRLSQKPWNQSLWKAYIKYFENEKGDSKDFLQVLSRYCRLFLGDKEMKEKYQNKIEKMTEICDFEISEFWIDLIKFEFQFNSVYSGRTLLEKALKIESMDAMKMFDILYHFFKNNYTKDCLKEIEEIKSIYLQANPNLDKFDLQKVLNEISFDNPLNQKLPFTKTVNNYILKNILHLHLRKLYQISKYFYYKYRLNLITRLEIINEIPVNNNQEIKYSTIQFKGNMVLISSKYYNWKNINNIYLTHSLFISNRYYNIKIFYEKIVKCELKFLDLRFLRLTPKEFNLLTNSQTIEFLRIQSTNITDEENNIWPVEKLLTNCLNVKKITLHFCDVTLQTFQELLSLEFKNKFQLFDFNTYQNLNSDHFINFITKNLAPKALLNLHKTNDFGIVDEVFKSLIQNKIQNWAPTNEKPICTFSSLMLT